jgi:hypothetical protein
LKQLTRRPPPLFTHPPLSVVGCCIDLFVVFCRKQ